MPQTREHFEICRLLGIRGGVIALTKGDLASPEAVDRARQQARALTAGSFLAAAPVVVVSSRTGAGIPELEAALLAAAGSAVPRGQDLPPRLPIDRVFTIHGFGTVVTGTLLSGRIAAGAELELWNGAAPRILRVRGVQVHGAAAEQAVAGDRVALNLAGVETAALARGMTLAAPGALRPTRVWDVELHAIPDAPAIALHSPLRLHLHSAETVARVVWWDATERDGDAPRWAQLRLARPLPAIAEDHFILRRLSPALTLGGGIVLDPGVAVGRHGNGRADRLRRLAASPLLAKLPIWAAAAGARGLPLATAAPALGRRPDDLRQWADTAAEGVLLAADYLWTPAAWNRWQENVLHALGAFHRAEPVAPGARIEALHRLLPPGAPPVLIRAALDRLTAAAQVERQGEIWRLPGRGGQLNAQELAARQRIEQAFLAAGYRAPAAAEVLAGAGVDARRAEQILRLLLREGILLRLTPDLILHRDAVADLRRQLLARRASAPRLSVAEFKSLTGVTRKYAIPLLEYLDRVHATRRVGDLREILPG